MSKTEITGENAPSFAELQRMALDAARQGDTEMLAPMIEAGLPVELKDGKGNSLLMLASYHGNAKAAGLLLEKGAVPDARNDLEQTPLAGVAFTGHLEIARLLLRAGADPLADQGSGKTPVMVAAMSGHLKMVRLLESVAAAAGSPQSSLGWLARIMALPRAIFFRKQLRPFVVGP